MSTGSTTGSPGRVRDARSRGRASVVSGVARLGESRKEFLAWPSGAPAPEGGDPTGLVGLRSLEPRQVIQRTAA